MVTMCHPPLRGGDDTVPYKLRAVPPLRGGRVCYFCYLDFYTRFKAYGSIQSKVLSEILHILRWRKEMISKIKSTVLKVETAGNMDNRNLQQAVENCLKYATAYYSVACLTQRLGRSILNTLSETIEEFESLSMWLISIRSAIGRPLLTVTGVTLTAANLVELSASQDSMLIDFIRVLVNGGMATQDKKQSYLTIFMGDYNTPSFLKSVTDILTKSPSKGDLLSCWPKKCGSLPTFLPLTGTTSQESEGSTPKRLRIDSTK